MNSELEEIIAFIRKGTTVFQLWKFVLQSSFYQTAWEEYYPDGKVDLIIWKFLLSPPQLAFIERWKQLYPEEENQLNPWWEILLTPAFPEITRAEVLFLLDKTLSQEEKEIFPFLLLAMITEESDISTEAAELLKRGSPNVLKQLPLFTKYLTHHNKWISLGCASALGFLGDKAKSAIPQLLLLPEHCYLPMDLDFRTLNAASWALDQIGMVETKDISTLLSFLSHSSHWTRAHTLSLFGSLKSKQRNEVPKNLEISKNSYLESKSSSPDVVQNITRALKDSHYGVRQNAASSLGRFGVQAKTAVPALIQAMKDESWQVRGNSLYALNEMNLPETEFVPLLLEFLQDEQYLVQREALHLLNRLKIGTQEMFQILFEALLNPEIQKMAAKKLHDLLATEPKEKTIPILKAALAHHEVKVQQFARQFLDSLSLS